MSNNNNIYNILNNFNKVAQDAPKPVVEQTESKPKTKLQESMEQVNEKYMGFKKTVAAIKKGGSAENPEAVAAAIGRKKYGKEKFQKAAAAGKKLGEEQQSMAEAASADKIPEFTQYVYSKLRNHFSDLAEVEDLFDYAYLSDVDTWEILDSMEENGTSAKQELKEKLTWLLQNIKNRKYLSVIKPIATEWTKLVAPMLDQQEMAEVAPPGAKAERMVKHIKKGYAKDGKLTPKEKSIAYATAWKAHNKGKVEETIQSMLAAGFTKEQIIEGWEDMMKDVERRGKEERGTGKFDKKKSDGGTVYTRKYNPKTGETDDTENVTAVKRGRGRPKKSAFESKVDKMIAAFEGSIEGGVWTANPPKKGQPNVKAPVDPEGGSAPVKGQKLNIKTIEPGSGIRVDPNVDQKYKLDQKKADIGEPEEPTDNIVAEMRSLAGLKKTVLNEQSVPAYSTVQGQQKQFDKNIADVKRYFGVPGVDKPDFVTKGPLTPPATAPAKPGPTPTPGFYGGPGALSGIKPSAPAAKSAAAVDPAVLAQQKELIAKGANIKADGIMGPKTQAAIKQFGSAPAPAAYAGPSGEAGQGAAKTMIEPSTGVAKGADMDVAYDMGPAAGASAATGAAKSAQGSQVQSGTPGLGWTTGSGGQLKTRSDSEINPDYEKNMAQGQKNLDALKNLFGGSKPAAPAAAEPAKPAGAAASAEPVKEPVKATTDQTMGEDSMDIEEMMRLAGMEDVLKGKQKKLDKNKNGKLDATDFAMLRGEMDEESGMFPDPGTMGGTQRFEYDPEDDKAPGDVEEGNAFSGAVAKAKADGIQPGEKIKVGGKEYPVKEDEEEVDEAKCNECGMWESKCSCEKVSESLNLLRKYAGLSECMSPMGNGMMGDEQEGKMNISTNMSSDGHKSVTVTADGNSAIELMQMLKLAGMGGDEAAAHGEPEGVMVVTTDDEEVDENFAPAPYGTDTGPGDASWRGQITVNPDGSEDDDKVNEQVPNPMMSQQAAKAKGIQSPQQQAAAQLGMHEAKDKRYHASTTPDEEVFSTDVQLKGGNGDVAGQEKKMRKSGYQFGDNNLAMKESMGSKLMREYEGIKKAAK